MNHQHRCDYCGKVLDRLMFCNHSHQVMYHKKKMGKKEPLETPVIIKKGPVEKKHFSSMLNEWV